MPVFPTESLPSPRRRPLVGVGLLLMLVPLAGCADTGPGSAGRGQALFATCIPCHGPDGGGRQDLAAPAIAGQQLWYLRDQLQFFRKSHRGLHPKDDAGLRMRSMARTLESDADVEAVAQYVASLPPARLPATVQGDPANGKVVYQVCVQCHGPAAEGIETQKAPSLNMTGDWYQLAQLRKFKAGLRGASAANAFGMVMRSMTLSLTEQSMKDVVAYIQTLTTQAAPR